MKDRPGVPDEARPIIDVASESKARAVAKWANDVHAGFDPLHRSLLEVAGSGKKRSKVPSSPPVLP